MEGLDPQLCSKVVTMSWAFRRRCGHRRTAAGPAHPPAREWPKGHSQRDHRIASGPKRTGDYAAFVSRIAATLLIVLGTLVVAFSPSRWDTVVLELPRGHGVHGHDLIGVALIGIAVALFWREPVAATE